MAQFSQFETRFGDAIDCKHGKVVDSQGTGTSDVGYQLGVDLGTTYSAAAIGRVGRVEMASFGTANPTIPSVVLLRADGEVLIGDVAVRRGDPTPLVLGGTPYWPSH